MVQIPLKKLNSEVQIPSYAHDDDVGLDLHSLELRTLNPGEPNKFKLGFALAIPEGHVGLIKDRSSMATKGLSTLGGVIDPGYRGELAVVIINCSEVPRTIRRGERLAQLLIVPVARVEIEETELPPAHRGDRGFGSSGR